MKLPMIAFWAHLLMGAASAHAAYPAAIEAHQKVQVDSGNCETDWKQLDEEQGRSYALTNGMKLWIVPCAQWAINLQATAYLEIPESTREGGAIFKPVLFIDYSTGRGLHPDMVTYNPAFDPKTLTLQSQQKFQYSDFCGSKAAYQWDEKTQEMKLTILIKNDECKKPAPWEKIYPSK